MKIRFSSNAIENATITTLCNTKYHIANKLWLNISDIVTGKPWERLDINEDLHHSLLTHT